MKSLSPFALFKSLRVSKQLDIDRLFKDSHSLLVYPVRCTYRFRDDLQVVDKGLPSPHRVMVVAPKRNHKRAVTRNLLKRRMREAFRLNRSRLDSVNRGLDISLSYVSKEVEDYQAIERAVIKIMDRICLRVETN